METGEISALHLRAATQRLKDDGHDYALPERLARVVRSIAADGRRQGAGCGSLDTRGDAETRQVMLQRRWGALVKTVELHRAAVGQLMDHLISSLPQGSRGTDILAETTIRR